MITTSGLRLLYHGNLCKLVALNNSSENSDAAFVSSAMNMNTYKSPSTTLISILIAAFCSRQFYEEIWYLQVGLDNSTMKIDAQ